MRSGGFVGKKQARNEPTRRSEPPKSEDLTQLLSTSQKQPEKPFFWSWQTPGTNSIYTLSVISTGASREKRGGWSSSASDTSALSDADWKLMLENETHRASEVFEMRTSDSDLILTLIDEALLVSGQVGELRDAIGSDAITAGSGADSSMASRRNVPPPMPGTVPVQEGNLRQTNIRSLMQSYKEKMTTGRLICDSGNTQAEVFFSSGEPVHAKSCHTIYQDKDCTGDSVIVDLLTWQEGNYKFQEGWPAASKSITHPMQMFLDGLVDATKPEAPAAPSVSASAGAPETPVIENIEYAEDFSNVDDIVAATYDLLVEPSGMIKYGMFLMLAQSEFVRFTTSNISFCMAAIGLELPNTTLTDDVLRQVGECFHPVCQPLDLLAYASKNRLFALFPQCPGVTAASTMKHFVNNVLSTQFDDNAVHGSSMKISIGLCEVPRDGTDFEHVIAHSVKLSRDATTERKVVTTVG